MIEHTPWELIQRPSSDYNVRLVPDSGCVRVFWGKGTNGKPLLLIELEGDNSLIFERDHVRVQGITVELQQSQDSTRQTLVFALERSADQDLFLTFCNALIPTLRELTDSRDAVYVALAHLRRWRAFLASGRTQGLSEDEVRGLFGELDFLMELSGKLPSVMAVEAWSGPQGGPQDFIFGDTAVEIKTIFGASRNSVRISSENQLAADCTTLILGVVRLTSSGGVDDSMSLNAKVQQVAGALNNAHAEEMFWTRIGSLGYSANPAYDSPEFQVTNRRYFSVGQGFPRLIRSELPAGIVRVSYDIQLETIENHEISRGALWSHPL